RRRRDVQSVEVDLHFLGRGIEGACDMCEHTGCNRRIRSLDTLVGVGIRLAVVNTPLNVASGPYTEGVTALLGFEASIVFRNNVLIAGDIVRIDPGVDADLSANAQIGAVGYLNVSRAAVE